MNPAASSSCDAMRALTPPKAPLRPSRSSTNMRIAVDEHMQKLATIVPKQLQVFVSDEDMRDAKKRQTLASNIVTEDGFISYTLVQTNRFLRWDETTRSPRQVVHELRGNHIIFSNLLMMKDPTLLDHCMFAEGARACRTVDEWAAQSKDTYVLVRVFAQDVSRDPHGFNNNLAMTTPVMQATHSTDCAWMDRQPSDCDIAMSALAMLPTICSTEL